jgi:prepilin-type N-terminal cleavage/methylation domain-containing protein
MKDVPFCHGASGPQGDDRCPLFSPHLFRRGFTLLEMCIVLLIIALLLGVTMPSIQSAFVEQGVRRDSHQLALMVKTAMIQSAEQHRPYAIDLTPTTMALHPVGEAAADVDAQPVDTDDSTPVNPATEDVEVTTELDKPNQLLVPDPFKDNAWIAMPPTSWIFQPGDLCPATRVRLERKSAWLEMSFNALTGNVENENTYFP